MVTIGKKSITYASKKLRIKYTRARSVICNYMDNETLRTEGTVKQEENSESVPLAENQES
jgi:hypothetical protein